MRPYSLDLRERVAAAVDHHDRSIRWIARIFRVSTSFIVRLLQHRRTAGTLAPESHRGGPPPALEPGDLERLAGLVREQPDATLEQLRQRGGSGASGSRPRSMITTARSAGSPESSASAPPLSSACSSIAVPPARSPPSRTEADRPRLSNQATWSGWPGWSASSPTRRWSN